MTSRIWLRLAEILVPALLAITILVTWQADRRDRAQLANQLAAAQKTIAQASASQHDRDAILNQTLAQIQAQKQAVVTPAQILEDLQVALSLPAPITIQSQAHPTTPAPSLAPQHIATEATSAIGSTAKSTESTRIPSTPTPKSGQAPDAILPAADLKPLYDFALDCKACQVKLAATQNDLNDERIKTAALTKERDAAVRTAKGGSALRRIVRAAKGGSALRRIVRAAKWFVLGAAAGAIAAKAVH
jgi:cobalamin biosynthesis Mg chelatase CobN